MIALTACLSLAIGGPASAGNVDGQDALKIAEQFARKARVAVKLKLEYLSSAEGRAYGFGAGKIHSVSFKGADGRRVLMNISSKGAVLSFFQDLPQNQRNSPPPVPRSINTPYFDPQPLAMKVAKDLGVDRQCQFRNPWRQNTGPLYNVVFDSRVGGHRFFDMNPTFGYPITFNANTMEVFNFQAPPPLPEVNAQSAKIGEAQAKEMLLHYGKTHYQTGGGGASMFRPDWPGKIDLTVELGYVMLKDDPKARLVWEGRVWSIVGGKVPPVDDGGLTMLVDAQTGKFVQAKDPSLS